MIAPDDPAIHGTPCVSRLLLSLRFFGATATSHIGSQTMNNELRERIAAVQLEHVDGQLTNYDTGREECGCGRQGSATYREHLADAILALPGIAVVELPEPMTDLSNVATMLAKSPNFQVGDSWACLRPDGMVEFETAQQQHYGIVGPQDARDLAAALLAAAEYAEKETK